MTENKYVGAKNNTARYQVDGWHIVDTQTPVRRIYIRELIEVGCNEFNQCEIPASERLKIIEAIGQERIFALMREVFAMQGRSFNEGNDGVFDIQLLEKMAQGEGAS